MALADEMLGIANEVTGGGSSLKYNKSYIGLAKDGKAVTFVVLHRRKKGILAEFKLQRTDEVSALVERAGIRDYKYNVRKGQLVISLDKAAVAKHRAPIADLIRLASGSPAPTED